MSVSIRIGSEWISFENLEALRCPFCGEFMDMADVDSELRYLEFSDHLIECGECSGVVTAPGDGYLYVEDGDSCHRFGEEELQPLVKNFVSEVGLEELFSYLDENGWSAELNEEEGTVVVEGLSREKYTVVPHGPYVYGEGPVRDKLVQSIDNHFNK